MGAAHSCRIQEGSTEAWGPLTVVGYRRVLLKLGGRSTVVGYRRVLLKLTVVGYRRVPLNSCRIQEGSAEAWGSLTVVGYRRVLLKLGGHSQL